MPHHKDATMQIDKSCAGGARLAGGLMKSILSNQEETSEGRARNLKPSARCIYCLFYDYGHYADIFNDYVGKSG